jgi:hypothetical protein
MAKVIPAEIKVRCDLASNGRWSIDFIKDHSLCGDFIKRKLPLDKEITFPQKNST